MACSCQHHVFRRHSKIDNSAGPINRTVSHHRKALAIQAKYNEAGRISSDSGRKCTNLLNKDWIIQNDKPPRLPVTG